MAGDFAGRTISCISFHVEWQVPDSELCQVIAAEKLPILVGRLSDKKITRNGKRNDKAENANKMEQRP